MRRDRRREEAVQSSGEWRRQGPGKKPERKDERSRIAEASGPSSGSAPTEEYIRVPLSRVDKLLYLVGEVVINKMKASVDDCPGKKAFQAQQGGAEKHFQFKRSDEEGILFPRMEK